MKKIFVLFIILVLASVFVEAKKHYNKNDKKYNRSDKNYNKKDHQWKEKNHEGKNYNKYDKKQSYDQKETKETRKVTEEQKPQPVKPRTVRTYSSSDSCPSKATYDFNLLTLSWTGQFCTEHDCVCMWDADWNGKMATVHGFWPSGSAKNYLDCFGYQGDQNCMKDAFAFDYSLLGMDTRRKMDIHWPEYGNKNCGDFYQYEWDKHGTCYLMNMIEDHKDEYQKDNKKFNETIFVEYFENVMNKVEERNISLKSGTTYQTKDDFAKDIGLKSSQFRVKCSRDNEVDEFQICYTRGTKPGDEVLMDCPQDYSSEGDCYGKPFVIK